MESPAFKPSIVLSALLLATSPVFAGSMGAVQSSNSPWTFDFGSRYWLGSGNYSLRLYDTDTSEQLNSKLSYKNFNNNSAEGIWRLEHQNGIFLKGYFGGGALSNGKMNDEDFPPAIEPYTNTYQSLSNGNISYLSLDLGTKLLEQERFRLDGFLGYHYLQERYNSSGCSQVGGGEICVPAISNSINGLNNQAYWNNLRLGIDGQLMLNPSFTVDVDLAFVHSALVARDFHNFRPDIRGIDEDGSGNGLQLDAMLNWQANQNLQFGIGGRYWTMSTFGYAHFEQTAAGGQPAPIKVMHSDYGLLLQSKYRFNEQNSKQSGQEGLVYRWQGPYYGANIGYGTAYNLSRISASPVQGLAFNVPANLNLQDAGFMAGGQLGYNQVYDRLLLGLEGDLDYSQISSINGDSDRDFLFFSATTVRKNLKWNGSLRARLAKLASENMLFYVTAGPALGEVEHRLVLYRQGNAFNTTSLLTASRTQAGIEAGAGLEFAVDPKTSFKAEYVYLDLGKLNSSLNTDLRTYNLQSNFASNNLRFGINRKFS